MSEPDPTDVPPGTAPRTDPTPEDRYLRLGVLGAGGGGEVLLVRDRVLARDVALKVSPSDRPDPGRRFEEEARLCGSLDHPNIVPVHDLGQDAHGRPWFTMKAVTGRTFHAVLAERAGRPPDPAFLQSALDVLLKVCDAVAFANARGVVHCDLKPANLMLGSFGEVYVMDWGIARSGGSDDLGDSGVSGTPGYMSPEQAIGAPPDERADVHGLGAILYEVLTGELPYAGPTGRARFAATLLGRIPKPTEVRPGWPLPERLCAIAMKALAPVPADRYPTVLALQAALRDVLRGGWWFDQQVFAAGTAIVREGDPADRAFIVVEGRATVRAGPTVVREVGPGEVFGELGLVAEGVRTADVVAETEVTAMVVTREALASELGQGSWLSLLVRSLALRFREAHEALHPPRGTPALVPGPPRD